MTRRKQLIVDRDALVEALRTLPEQGATGFEGLIRDLLQRWSQQSFFLATQGTSQHGHDVRNQTGVFVECKKFNQNTRLDERGLIGELRQAIDRYPGIELYVLVTSKELGSNELGSLERCAEADAVEFLAIDVRSGGSGPLPALCARFEDTTLPFLERHAASTIRLEEVKKSLQAILQAPGYVEQVAALERTLSARLLGLAGAKRRLTAWLKSRVLDSADAQDAFNQDMALRRPDRRPIPRRGINRNLDQWWQAVSRSHLVILGEEGTGKSWASMGWLLDLIEQTDSPLVIPLTSNRMPTDTAKETIANVLHHRLSELGKGKDWWQRKVQNWWPNLSGAGGILLWLDGLNEQPGADWRSLLGNASTTDSQGKVFVLGTCRPGFWKERLALPKQNCSTIDSTGYDDGELATILNQSGNGLTLGQIPTDLRPLARRPRYCQLIIDHFDELMKAGQTEITVEWLLFIDYEKRWQQRKNPGTRQSFNELLGSLAKLHLDEWRRGSASPALGLRELDEALPSSSDAERIRILQDIVDGGLLVSSGQQTRPYRVDPQRLAYGLGMLLVDDLRDHAGSIDDCAHHIQAWLEPQRDMDAKTTALGAAVRLSLPAVNAGYRAVPRQALLREWIAARNRPNDPVCAGPCSAIRTHLLACPADLLAIADYFWSSAHENEGIQQGFAEALLAHRDHPAVLPELVKATGRWMSLIVAQGDPFRRQCSDMDKSDPAADLQTRLGARPIPGTTQSFCRHDIAVTDDDSHLRLARFAAWIISAGGRRPFVGAMVRWALSRSLMDHFSEQTEMEWLLRLTDEDLWPDFVPKLTALIATNDKAACKAAHCLAGLVGSRDALAWRDTRLADLYPPSEFYLAYQRDPFQHPLFAWPRDRCAPGLARSDIPLWQRIRGVSPHCIDPALNAPEAFKAMLISVAGEMPLNDIRPMLSQTEGDLNLTQINPVLARFAPDALALLARRLIAECARRRGDGAYYLAFKLMQLALVADQEAIRQLGDAVVWHANTVLSMPTDESDKEQAKRIRATECSLFETLAVCLPADEMIESYIERPVAAYDTQTLRALLDYPTESLAARLADRLLGEEEPQRQARLLHCLGSAAQRLTDGHRRRILHLAESGEDWAPAAALRLIYYSCDRQMVAAVIDSGRKFPDSGTKWGQHLLRRSGLPLDQLLGRVPLACISFAVAQPGQPTEDLDVYTRLVDRFWQDAEATTSTSESDINTDPGGCLVSTARDGAVHIEPFDDHTTIHIGVNPNSWLAKPGAGFEAMLDTLNNGDDTSRYMEERRAFHRQLELVRANDAPGFITEQFCVEGLTAIAIRHPATVAAWARAILDRSRNSRTAGGFAQSLCAALANTQPELGFQLWGKIVDSRFIRFIDRQSGLDWMIGLPFSAVESPASLAARQKMLETAADDAKLTEIAVAAIAFGCRPWLQDRITDLITSPFLWRRAKGLTLAALADIAPTLFDELERRVEGDGTWVEDIIAELRSLHNRGQWARHWYRQFLISPHREEAYAGFILFLRCVDSRFSCWGTQMEEESRSDSNCEPYRLRYRIAHDKAIADAIKENEKERSCRFLTKKFDEREIVAPRGGL